MTAAVALNQRMSEEDWTATVIQIAKLYGWMVCHIRPARTEKGWRTPIQGDKGLLDVILARHGDVLLVENKSNTGRLRPEQRVWLEHLGPFGHVWRPRDIEIVHARLARPTTRRRTR